MDIDFTHGDRVRVSENDKENASAEGKYIGIMPIGDLRFVVIELDNEKQIVVFENHVEKVE